MSKVTIGNYEVIKQIGEGGCARTYLARHVFLGEPACLKQNLEITKEEEEALLKEARVLWHIHHYSLPTLRDYIKCDDGSFVLVMSFIKGKDLYKIIEEDFPEGIDPEHVCWMTQRLLNALHYLHFHGIIHGDVKPQNIIVKPEDHNAVLVDYGLASVRPRSRPPSPGCTPAFAAPEQLAGMPPIPETDLYGLGTTMIFALGGNIVGKIFPSHVHPLIKEFFDRLVLHDPMKRPKTASELIKPLSDIREKVFGRRTSSKELKIS